MQIIRTCKSKKNRSIKKKGLEDTVALESICIALTRSGHRGLRRQSANNQHGASTGRLHCDLCLEFCMKDCVTILVMSPAASSSVGWSSGRSVVSAEGKDPTLQQPPSQRPVKRLRLQVRHRNNQSTNYSPVILKDFPRMIQLFL